MADGGLVGAEDDEVRIRVIHVGALGAGKTSLKLRMGRSGFWDRLPLHLPLFDPSIARVAVGQRPVKLWLEDSAGQERFRALVSGYYRAAHVVLFVFDVTQRTSFEDLPMWVADVRQKALPDVACVVVGTKTDQPEDRVVTREEAEAFAASIAAPLFEVSSKTEENVGSLVDHVAARGLRVEDARAAERTMRERPVELSRRAPVGQERPGGCC